MDSNVHCSCVTIVPDDVPSTQSSLLCPTHGGGGCFACQETSSLEREAAEISKKLANVLAKLASARSVKNYAHSTILAKLPNEILSHIFCAAWNAVDPSPPRGDICDYYEEPQKENRLSVALLLAGVCKRWRALTLAIPQIWTDIHVFIHRQKGDSALSILHEIVKRSKHTDLTIRLYSEPFDNIDRIDEIQPALSILQKESERWRSLQMCLPYRLISALFKPNMDLSQVNLLYVHSNERDYMGFGDPLWKDKGLRPQRLWLQSPAMQKIALSWDRVTHIVAHRFNTDHAMTVIRSAPLLTTLELMDMDEATEATEIYSGNFVHEKLQCLIYYAMDHCSAEWTLSLFDLNVFPSLKTVDYHTLFKTDDDPFLDHLMQKKPPIQELRLCGSPYESWCVMLALRAVGSTLKRLDFEPYEDDHDDFEYGILFEHLAVVKSYPPSGDPSDSGDDQQMFLPRLEYFKLTSGWPFAWDRVPAFFGSPSDPYRRPLKEFRFSAYNDHRNDDHIIPKKDLLALINLRNAGFVVESRGLRDMFEESLDFHDLGTPTSTPPSTPPSI
ncbi:hypothetical protein CPC08DRAFT_708210 [Agrocybe pediades]|nr:hypothetical protein CPC08DRAFT_708210 [Agrocybe pediades]